MCEHMPGLGRLPRHVLWASFTSEDMTFFSKVVSRTGYLYSMIAMPSFCTGLCEEELGQQHMIVGCSFLLRVESFLLTIALLTIVFSSLLAYNWSSFACSGKLRLISTSAACKQRSSTVNKKLQLYVRNNPTLSIDCLAEVRNAIE